MKISLNWLCDYVDFNLSAEAIGVLLSDRGFPYEAIIQTDDDTVIDVEVTSNRGDCLSHIGIARELAAATGKALKLPKVELAESGRKAAELVKVEIANPQACGRYTARVIENVKVGSTPEWMRKRLEAVGLRSINNVVDATNYALMETGQPPHAFDFATIGGATIIVRNAAGGERLVSIDGTKCDLAGDMLVIADAQKPVALAGVMGGLETEVSDRTTTVLLEDASFTPLTVRLSSRRLGIKSDACYRFERIVDIDMIDWASRRTAQLITMVAGGQVASGVVDVYPGRPAKKVVTLRLSRLKKLLGIEVSFDTVKSVLAALSFAPQPQGDNLICTIPSWRSDVYREVDLIEEFARMYGFDKIHTEQRIHIDVAPVDARQKLMNCVRTFANAAGFFETINVTFTDDLTASLFTGRSKDEHLSVLDVSRKSANLLRQTLIGSLAQCLKSNANAKNTGIRLYELSDTFTANKPGQMPIERTKFAAIADGDFREIRGLVEGLCAMIDRDMRIDFVPTKLVWADAAAEIIANGKPLGVAGVISKSVLDKLDIKAVTPSAALEIDFDLLAELQSGPKKIKPIPRFPAIDRDLSIIVDENVRWSQILKAINSVTLQQLEGTGFTGIYRGKPIPQGRKSVTLSLRFRDDDGTLTHEMVDAFQQTILKALQTGLNAELRTA